MTPAKKKSPSALSRRVSLVRDRVTRSIVWDPKVLAAAKQAAAKDDRSLSNYVNVKLREVLGLPPVS